MSITKKELFKLCDENHDAINELRLQSDSTDFVLATLIQQLKDLGVISEVGAEKELLEVDLSSELTGSDYYYSNITSSLLESGSKLVVCFVSNVSESDALSEKHIEVITSLDTSFNDSDGYGWQYAVPINNQGEPLTASEAGF